MSGSKTPTVIATTALVVAVLAATPIGEAAGRLVLPNNSVGAVQIKKSAVTGLKVKNGTLMAADFKPGQLPAGPQGPKGEAGPQGPKGDNGAVGAPGLSELQRVEGPQETVPPAGIAVATATCPVGKKAVGGGFGGTPGVIALSSSPNASFDSWTVLAQDEGGKGGKAIALAVCVKVAP
jgi:hypothetical protein